MGIVRRAVLAVALAGIPAAAPGQAGSCGRNGIVVPDLGFNSVNCSHCSIEFSPRYRRYRFSTEPRISGIHGAGAGRLRENDVLAAIDGRLITTSEAGDRLASVRRGERVRLTVRRGGGTQDVDVVAGQRCMEIPVPPEPPTPPPAPRAPLAPRAPGAPGAPTPPPPPPHPGHPNIPEPPQPPEPPAPPLPPPPPDILPEGWFGFGISCDECGIHRHNDDVTMFFRQPPVVESVEPGSPAARAGMQRGDVLMLVDGLSLTMPAGANRFASIRPGQTVTWTYRRGSRSYAVRATAGRRPDHAAAAPAARSAAAQQLRYSGAVGNTDVEVRGAPVTIIRDEHTGEMVIRSHDLTVRIRPDGSR